MSGAQTPTTTFRDMAYRISPSWLRGPIGAPFMKSMAIMFDAVCDGAAYAVRARFPATAPTDAFPYLQADRQVDPGFQEPQSSYIERLIEWLDLWRLAGTDYAILLVMLGYVAPDEIACSVVSNDGDWNFYLANAGATVPQDFTSMAFVPPTHQVAPVWDWDGAGDPYYLIWQWWRFWVILYPDAGLWTYGRNWGDGWHWGDGTCWGWNGTAAQGASLRALVKKWKTAGAYEPNLIISFDPTWFAPSSPPSKLPDGHYGHWSKIIIGFGGVRQRVPARQPVAAYADGVS
jgi:hypothetical protein